MDIYYNNQTIWPVHYFGEVPLRRVPRVIGHLVDRGHYGIYEVTRIEPNGQCFGIDIRFKEEWRVTPYPTA